MKKKSIKTMTAAEFRELYLNNTLVKVAKILRCSRGNVLYHARRHNLLGIKNHGGPVQKIRIVKEDTND